MRPVTPRGFRDVLFQEAAERRLVTDAVGRVFASWGYGFVETPAVEEYRTLEAAAGSTLEGTAFRLFDVDGSLLALRPEMTLPIARLVATRLADEPGPHRICYTAEVFREHASLRGEARQFTQTGVELVGPNGAASDAEIVSVLIDALAAAGLDGSTVGIGTVETFRALLNAAGGDAGWRDEVMTAAHRRDLVGLDALTRLDGLDPAAAEALRSLPRIGGGADAIERCRALLGPAGCAAALDPLAETWGLLEATGAADRVRVDFGILRSFDYYTGMIVEAYAPGLGVPLGGGGRYDDVLATYGRPMPAAGFALSLDRVRIALESQGGEREVGLIDAVVGGADAVIVLAAAARLRRDGARVRAAVGADERSTLEEAVRFNARAIIADADGLRELDTRVVRAADEDEGGPR